MKLRSSLGQARGLGSAKSGVQHWLAQRVTAVTLIGLSIWFMASILTLTSLDRLSVIDWAQAPHNTMLLLAMMLVLLYHSRLGLQVVIEDYIHSKVAKIVSLLLLYLVNISAMIIAAYALLTIGLG